MRSKLGPSSSTCLLSLAAALVVLLVAAELPDGASGQTFHYSHGWTNGKRSGAPPLSPSNLLMSKMAVAAAGAGPRDSALEEEVRREFVQQPFHMY